MPTAGFSITSHFQTQTVERLEKRIEQYRSHHKSSLSKYEQDANGLDDSQRTDTLLLLEMCLKATTIGKKCRSDHQRTRLRNNPLKELSVITNSLPHSYPPKKRSAEDRLHCTSTPDALSNDEKPSKIARPADPLLYIRHSSLPPSFSVQKQGCPEPGELGLEDTNQCQAYSSGVQLSEIIPSLELTDMCLPDMLKDLIEDVMKDLNCEDSGGNMNDLVKGQRRFRSSVDSPTPQQNSIFQNMFSDNNTSLTPSTLSKTTTSAVFHTKPSQQPSYGSSNLSWFGLRDECTLAAPEHAGPPRKPIDITPFNHLWRLQTVCHPSFNEALPHSG